MMKICLFTLMLFSSTLVFSQSNEKTKIKKIAKKNPPMVVTSYENNQKSEVKTEKDKFKELNNLALEIINYDNNKSAQKIDLSKQFVEEVEKIGYKEVSEEHKILYKKILKEIDVVKYSKLFPKKD